VDAGVFDDDPQAADITMESTAKTRYDTIAPLNAVS
jgi:hypothetical protein